MVYEIIDAFEYLSKIGDLIRSKPTKEVDEKIASGEFAILCRDVVESFRASQKSNSLDFGIAINPSEINSAPYDIRRIQDNYLLAVGVVAASVELPEQQKALSYVSGFIENKGMSFLIDGVKEGFDRKFKLSKYADYPLYLVDGYVEFNPPVQGFTLLAGDHVFLESRREFLTSQIKPISVFLEKFEKTRDTSPRWNQVSGLIKHRYSEVADEIGRKNDDLAKIFRLVNDGAVSVSIDDCVNATKDIANVLMDPGYASRVNFTAALDVLDEHPDFWKVAFQDELLGSTRQYSFVNEVVRQWPDEDRKVFQSNLSELNERIQGKVADANVLLSSLLLGKSVTS